MSRACKEEPVVGAVNTGDRRQAVEILRELAVGILVGGFVVAGEKVGLQAEPVRSVGALLGDEIDGEAGGGEDLIWVQGFGDEEAGWVAVVERSGGRSNGDDGAAWKRHCGVYGG